MMRSGWKRSSASIARCRRDGEVHRLEELPEDLSHDEHVPGAIFDVQRLDPARGRIMKSSYMSSN
jgi:hypothetical protein